MSDTPKTLLPCPFCGTEVELPEYGQGTCYEGPSCCIANTSIQICDHMTIEERIADPFTDYRYKPEYVERAKQQAIEQWNERKSPWIYPDDELPEIDTLVFGLDETFANETDSGAVVTRFDGKRWGNQMSYFNISVWMPVPPINNKAKQI